MRERRDFSLPGRRVAGWWALLAAVVAHLVIFSIPATRWFWADGPPPSYVIPIAVDLVQEPVEFRPEPPDPRRERRPPPPPPIEAPDAPEVPPPPGGVVAAEPEGLPGGRPDTAGVGVPVPEGVPVGIPRLRPSYGEGKLWVQPLPLPPRELAERLTRTHFELVDSAVSAIVQAYIDSMLAAPTPADNRPPSWTTTIGGKTFGIDSKSIHLGGFKIPTALLALLPISQSANLDLRHSERMNAIRDDLLHAANRAETMDEFKRAIREIRERREQEREFERNQRRAPPDTTRRP